MQKTNETQENKRQKSKPGRKSTSSHCNTPFSQLKNFLKHLSEYTNITTGYHMQRNPKQLNNKLTK